MVYYVRKINKKKSLEKIQTARSVSAIIADVLNEFRITNGDLSVWKIQDLQEIEIAMLAIAITSDKLDRMDFLIISEDIIKQSGFSVTRGPSGYDLCDYLEDRHYNINNLTVGNINKCVEIYRKAIKGLDLTKINNIIPRKNETELGKIIHNAFIGNQISEDDIKPECLKYIKEKKPKILQTAGVAGGA